MNAEAEEIMDAFETLASHTPDNRLLKELAAVVGQILLPHCVILEIEFDEDEDWADVLDTGNDTSH